MFHINFKVAAVLKKVILVPISYCYSDFSILETKRYWHYVPNEQ